MDAYLFHVEANIISSNPAFVPETPDVLGFDSAFIRWKRQGNHAEVHSNGKNCNRSLYLSALLTMWEERSLPTDDLNLYLQPKHSSMTFEKAQANLFQLLKNNSL